MGSSVYRLRSWLAWPPSAFLFLLIAFGSVRTLVPAKPEQVLSTVEILFAQLIEEPVAPLPEPTVTPTPRSVQAPTRPVLAPQPSPSPTPAASAQPTPSAAAADAAPQVAEPQTPAVKPAEPAPAPPRPAPTKSVDMEGGFVAKLRGYLNSIKRYPTGREASMQRPRGKVRVWFVLARGGELKDSGIEDSSNSMLLDGAALATLRRGTFPAFPDDAWPGASTRRFTVDLDFVPVD